MNYYPCQAGVLKAALEDAHSLIKIKWWIKDLGSSSCRPFQFDHFISSFTSSLIYSNLRKHTLTSAEAGTQHSRLEHCHNCVSRFLFSLKLLFLQCSSERLCSFCKPQQDGNNSATSLSLAIIKAACWLCLWMTWLLIYLRITLCRTSQLLFPNMPTENKIKSINTAKVEQNKQHSRITMRDQAVCERNTHLLRQTTLWASVTLMWTLFTLIAIKLFVELKSSLQPYSFMPPTQPLSAYIPSSVTTCLPRIEKLHIDAYDAFCRTVKK